MLKRSAFIALALISATASPAQAAVVTVDFSGHSLGSPIADTYAPLGLTFSDATFAKCSGGCPAPDPNGWFAYGGGAAFTAFFASPQSSVSFQGVSFSDTLAQAFDATNTLVASTVDHQLFPVDDFVRQLTGLGIVRIEFTDAGGDGLGPAITNLTFDATTAAVPEPATWAMMLLGFAVAGGALRSRKRQPKVSYAF